MGMIPAAAATIWGLLVAANWWPAFAFPFRDSLAAFSLQGFPFDSGLFLGAAGGHFRRGLFAVLVLVSVRGWGSAIPRLARLPDGAPLLRFCLGLPVFSGLILGLGLTGLLHAPILWAVLVGGILSGGIPPLRGVFPGSFPRPALVLVAITFVPALFAALAPEVTYDALAYHLGAPEQWLKAGRIVRLEHMFFSDFPLILQSAYLVAMGTGGGTGSAKIIHFILGVLCVGAAARLGEKAGGRSAGGWAGVFMAGAGLVTTQMGKANVDLGVVLTTATGLLLLLESRRTGAVLAAGLCLGTAAGIKLTGGIGAVAGLLLLVRRDDPAGSLATRRGPGVLLLFSSAVVAPLLPWLVRSWLGTGNPVYPFLFGGLGWTPANSSAYRFDMTGPTSFNVQYPGLAARLAGPWLSFMHDRGTEAALGWFMPFFAPLAVVLRGKISPVSRRIGLFALVYWLIWFVAARDPRFFLPALPACAALSAALLVSVPGIPGRVLAGVFGAAALFAPAYAAHVTYRTLNPGPVVWGALDRAIYENALIPSPNLFAPMARATADLAAGQRILVVGDVKAAFIRGRTLYQSLFDTPQIESAVRESGTPGDLERWFRQRRIGTVLFNPGGAVFLRSQFGHYQWSARERRLLGGFWGSHLSPIREMREGGELAMGLYRVGRRPGPRSSIMVPGDSR